jgi:DNA-binding transcriptional MerR regulator
MYPKGSVKHEFQKEIIMSHRDKLLSIGEVSKLTGAGIKALRYYERKNILPPAYIEPDSKYRYYSLEQVYLVTIIMFCVELDIPLKELSNFTDENGSFNFEDFLINGKQIAKKKMKALQKGLRFIDEIESKNQLIEFRMTGEIYSREIPEKVFYVKPCGHSLEDINILEVVRSFSDAPYAAEYIEIPEYGFLCKYSPAGQSYYAFVEIPAHMESEETMKIPAGKYFCKQIENSKIEQTPEIFSEYLGGSDTFLAIETEEFYVGKHKKNNNHINELRVIPI